MVTMTALEAKNGFGQFLDAVQRGPVTVTKNGREVGTMISRADLEKMGARLFPPLKEAVERGEISISDALLKQVEVDRRLEEAEADVAAGRVYEMDDAYFERLREHVRLVAAKR
jgi:prevent-host-death family protein